MGGGTFVLKFDETSSIYGPSTKTFSASYGGVLYIYNSRESSLFSILRIDGKDPSGGEEAFTTGAIYVNGSIGSSVHAYTIPFGNSCMINVNSNFIYYALYKYELIQS